MHANDLYNSYCNRIVILFHFVYERIQKQFRSVLNRLMI